jgi:hypothetical protein
MIISRLLFKDRLSITPDCNALDSMMKVNSMGLGFKLKYISINKGSLIPMKRLINFFLNKNF